MWPNNERLRLPQRWHFVKNNVCEMEGTALNCPFTSNCWKSASARGISWRNNNFREKETDNRGGSAMISGAIFNVEGIMFTFSFLSLFGKSEEHTSELQSRFDIVCRLLLDQ